MAVCWILCSVVNGNGELVMAVKDRPVNRSRFMISYVQVYCGNKGNSCCNIVGFNLKERPTEPCRTASVPANFLLSKHFLFSFLCVLSGILSLWFRSFGLGREVAPWVKLSLNLPHRHQKVSSAFYKNMENSGHFKVHFSFLWYMKEKKLPFGTALLNLFPWVLVFCFCFLLFPPEMKKVTLTSQGCSCGVPYKLKASSMGIKSWWLPEKMVFLPCGMECDL